MALESLPKIAPALFSSDQDLIQVYNKKTDTIGTINPSYIKSSPSGSAGAIQFSDGSAFASDSNLFWDNTNKRLGINNTSPSYTLDIGGILRVCSNGSVNDSSLIFKSYFTSAGIGQISFPNELVMTQGAINSTNTLLKVNYFGGLYLQNNLATFLSSGNIGFGTTSPSARVHIQGSGSTSATTSLLVQNSSGTAALSINDALVATFGNNVFASTFIGNIRSDNYLTLDGAFYALRTSSTGNVRFPQSVSIGTSSEPASSASLDLVSTTKGFLPPRMTTTQKNAIATPAAGLMVFDTDLGRPCFYSGSAWVTL